MNNPLFQQIDDRFREYLRSNGIRGTHHRATILQVFLENTKPVTAKDIHYGVKAVNLNVSYHCVYQTMGLLVKSGMAKEIIQDDGTARRYTHDIAMAECKHEHCVCRDCGATVG